MKVLELFSGTRSIGKAFEARGHEVFSVDYDQQFEADLHEDIGLLTAKKVLKLFGQPDVIWASPDCRTYSIAAIWHHRDRQENGNLAPRSDYAKFCDSVNMNVLKLINDLKPPLYFIENPQGGLKKMDFMRGLYCYTITYCQYGDSRMKLTNIWTNHPHPQFKPPCNVGDPCHERAPRGSHTTGTLGLKDSVERARIPEQLCEHIVDISEEYMEVFDKYVHP